MTTPAMIPARPQLQYLHDALEDLKSKHLYSRLKILEGEQKPVAVFDGKEVINLSSNNYLGLTTHPKLRRAAIEAITQVWRRLRRRALHRRHDEDPHGA